MRISPWWSSLSVVLLAVACNQNLEQTSPEPPVYKTGPGYEYHVDCVGSCPSSPDCDLIKDAGGTAYTCPCTGTDCQLQVTLLGEAGYQVAHYEDEAAASVMRNTLGAYGLGKDDLDLWMEERRPGAQYKIDSLRYFIQERTYGIQFFCRFSSDDALESVILMYRNSDDSPIDPETDEPVVYYVSCTGDCGEATSTCRERWILGNPPVAECTCESDNCSMVVSDGPIE